MAKVLVVGGVGFIGSHLTEKLVAEGHAVTILDNFSRGTKENIAAVIKDVNLMEGDMLDEGVLAKAVKEKEYIFHLAANTSVNASLEKPAWSAVQNIIATVKLLEAAVKYKVKRVIFSSSAAVYGYCNDLPIKESAPRVPASPYALEKVTGENYMRLFASLHDLDTVALCYFNVYGPRQTADLPHPGGVTIVIDQIRAQGASQLMGDGKQTRDMIYVGDVVHANLLAMSRDKRLAGGAYNISTGKSIVIADMHDKIAALMGVEPRHEYIAFPEGNIIDSCGDNSRAVKELGFAIEVDLEEGLRRTIAWSEKQNG